MLPEDEPDHKFGMGDTVQNGMGTKWNVGAVYWDVEREKLVYYLTWEKQDAHLVVDTETFDEEFQKA